MIRKWIVLLLLTAFAVPAAANVIIITKAGYFLLTQDASGNPSLTKASQVLDLRTGDPAPNPQPGPPPNPTTPLNELKKIVQEATAAVPATTEKEKQAKDRTKMALAQLYQTSAGLPVVSASQLRQATDTIFDALTLPQQWLIWKGKIDQAVASFADVDSAKKAWKVIADELERPVL